MVELFMSWRQPTSTGGQLFDSVPIKKIENFLNQVGATQKFQQSKSHQSTPTPTPPPGPATTQPSIPQGPAKVSLYDQARKFTKSGPLAQPELLSQVGILVELARLRKESTPSDPDTDKQLKILNELKSELGTKTFGSDVLSFIQTTLTNFTNDELDLKKKEKSPVPPSIKSQPDGKSPRTAAASLTKVPKGPSSIPDGPSGPISIPSGPAALSPVTKKREKSKKRENSQSSPYVNLNFTPAQLQQLQQIVSGQPVPQTQAPMLNVPQQYPTMNPRYPINPNLGQNPYLLSALLGINNAAPSPAPNILNAQNQQLLSALQGMQSIQTLGNIAPTPIQPKPYESTSRYGKQPSAYEIPSQPGQNSNLKSTAKPYGSPSLMSSASKKSDSQLALVDLTSASLSKPRPDLIPLLYGSMPKLCSTCGKRFPDSAEGRKVREAHLDWHFRVNKKLREENWTQMRSWYISEKDWIQLQEESELDAALKSTAAAQRAKAAEQARNKKKKKNGRSNSNNMAQGPNFGTSGGTNPNGSNSNGGTSVKIPKLNLMKLNPQQLRSKNVPLPTDKAVVGTPCPICREKFAPVFDDDTEEWVWKNAVQVNGKFFHATCYAEAEREGGEFLTRVLISAGATGHEGEDHGAAEGGTGKSGSKRNKNKRIRNRNNKGGTSNFGGNDGSHDAGNDDGSFSKDTPANNNSAAPGGAQSGIPIIPGGIDLTAILESVKRKRDEIGDGQATSDFGNEDGIPAVKREKVEQ